VGEARVSETLTAYRDAIQYVHDQTVRGMNRGATPDELAASIELPPHLAEHPWLQEHYGRVPWSVRAVYTGYLGWFDGDGSRLEPLPPADRAQRYIAAFSAGAPLPEQARAALEAGDATWAAELARLWQQAEPENDSARALLAQTYEALAAGHHNPCAHHWYATQAAELRGDLTLSGPDPQAIDPTFLDTLPIDAFMRGMATRLKAEDTLDADLTVRFVFEDVGRTWVVHVRGGVAEVRERDAQAAVTIRTTAHAWRRLVARNEAARAIRDGALSVEGDAIELMRFLSWFER
jgi:alkyl sulfatase BDS1-like metallo-beta-lactamase superfamily hydrolase